MMIDDADNAFTDLQLCIERLYDVFGKYPLRERVEGCSHCVFEEDHTQIHSKPLREMGVSDLRRFANDVLLVWGDVDDFKHFLPRLYELGVSPGLGYVGPEILFRKLGHADWRTWPTGEQEAVESYLGSVWQYVLMSREPFLGETDSDEYLCGIGQAMDDLTAFLDVWQTRHHSMALANLSCFVEWNARSIREQDRLMSPFWMGREAQAEQVIDWLLSARTLESFVTRGNEAVDQTLVTALDDVVLRLEQLQNWTA